MLNSLNNSPHRETAPPDPSVLMAELTDEELAVLAQGGDTRAEEYLLTKYKASVRKKAASYFLVGADRDDIIQEGMIGLYKAVRDYRGEKQASFKAFAELCVTRQIITAIKTATRKKHTPLNSYVSLNKPLGEEGGDGALIDVFVKERTYNPEEIVIDQESLTGLEHKMTQLLSDLELKVLNYYLQGKSYVEISELLGKHVKSVDNALQRIKTKLERLFAKEDAEGPPHK